MTYTDKELEVILQNYKSLLSAVRNEEENALYPYMPQEENIGGGKSNVTSDPTFRLAMALLRRGDTEAKRNVKAIQATYARLNVDQKRMMELYYFERSYGMNETQMAIRLGSDRSHLWRQGCQYWLKSNKRNQLK